MYREKYLEMFHHRQCCVDVPYRGETFLVKREIRNSFNVYFIVIFLEKYEE